MHSLEPWEKNRNRAIAERTETRLLTSAVLKSHPTRHAPVFTFAVPTPNR